MTVEIALVLLLVVAALILFASEMMPIDLAAITIMVTVIAIPAVFGDLLWLRQQGVDLRGAFPTIAEGLSGLSNPATITVLAMFILSAGVQRTGLIYELGKRLFPIVGSSEVRQILMIALLVAPVSGFINNTAAVAVLLPMVMDMARHSGRSPAKLLMPLSFFGQLGGTLTLIGTSTNLLAAAIVADPEQGTGKVIGMFEFTHVGLIILAAGLIYFLLIGRHLLPSRQLPGSRAEDQEETFIIELRVQEGSALADKELDGSGFIAANSLELIRLRRGARGYTTSAGRQTLQAGDVLVVRAPAPKVKELQQSDQVQLLAGGSDPRRVATSQARLVRVMLRSPRVFRRRPAGDVDFRGRYRARLVGVETHSLTGTQLVDHLLHVGEIVLLATSARGLRALERSSELVVMEQVEDAYERDKRWHALAIVVAVVLIPTLTPVPILVTALMGVVLMMLTRVLRHEELYGAVSWEVIFLLAGVIPLGVAMTKSGAADWVAMNFVSMAGDWHPLLLLMGLYLLTTVLTELVSNNASAVILVPIAIAMARQLGVEPFPLVLVVMLAASTTFLTPVGYQTNAMVYGTGLYRFFDFARVGGLLNILLLIITSFAISVFFPLR